MEPVAIFTTRTGSPFTIYDCTTAVSNCPRWVTNAPNSPSSNAGLEPNIGANNFLYMALPVDPSTGLAVGTGDSLEVPGKYNTDFNNTFCNGAAVLSGSNYSCSGLAPGRRNAYNGPVNWTFSGVVAKNFKLTERFNMQFRFEMYNMFNHSNYYVKTSNADVSAASPRSRLRRATPVAGTVPNEHRDIQFGLKLNF